MTNPSDPLEQPEVRRFGKRTMLIHSLAEVQEPQVLPIQRFFDGNTDDNSIGCNLEKHPGIETFKEAFTSLEQRPDVEAIYAVIGELIVGEGRWPFTDTLYIAGTIPMPELEAAVAELKPDYVGEIAAVRVPMEIATQHGAGPYRTVWWD